MKPLNQSVELSKGGRKLEIKTGRMLIVLMLGSMVYLAGQVRVLAQGQAELIVVGSAGTVDEADQAKFEVRNQFATIKDIVTGTVVYRYNLPATANFQDSADAKTIRIRYRDTGANQNVTVRLKAAHLGEDGVDTIYTFNSDSGSTGGGVAGANMNGNQTFDECSVTLPGDHILHGRYGYFLEVEITKTANDGTPSPGFNAFVISDSGITDICP